MLHSKRIHTFICIMSMCMFMIYTCCVNLFSKYKPIFKWKRKIASKSFLPQIQFKVRQVQF